MSVTPEQCADPPRAGGEPAGFQFCEYKRIDGIELHSPAPRV
jgi:hypothetical protein